MAFIETPRFPDTIAVGAEGGAGFLTQIAATLSGYEQRNIAWTIERRSFVVSLINRDLTEIQDVAALMLVAKGQANGFRFKDFLDYTATIAEGILGTGVGTGLPTYQMKKRYAWGTYTHDRSTTKPISPATVERNASPVVIGASPLSAGNATIDYTTGILTFTADASASVTAVTVGATTQITLSSDLIPLSVAEKLYLSGLTGTVATTLNGLAHTITQIQSGNVYVISTSTVGLAYTSGGTGYAYPQAGETLKWSGEFDVPVRFNFDRMRAAIILGGPTAQRLATWDQIELLEIRV